MRTHNTPRLCAGPQTAGTPIKFWNVASIGDDERWPTPKRCCSSVTTRARSPSTATS